LQSAPIWITAIVFALTYLGLAIGKIPGLGLDRAAIAFVGAASLLCLGALTLGQAVAPDSIDYATLALLFGMMVVVAFLRLSGVFAGLTNWTLARVRTPHALLFAIIFLSGLLSAFLVNDVVCVAITPLIVHLVKRLRFDPLPQLLGLATAANIGSVATITGNPQNMIIGIASHISYLSFAAHLLPVATVGLLVDFALLCLIYRGRLVRADADANAPATNDLDDGAALHRPGYRWLQRKSVIVTSASVMLFFCGLPIALVAMGAAAVLLLDRLQSEKIYRQIDWSLLLMFGSLFVVVHAFQLHVVALWHVEHWTWLTGSPVVQLSLVSAVLSNLVSNVPAVLLFEPIVQAIAVDSQTTAWLALAMSSTLAGNLTVLGSVANLIVLEGAKREGIAISFWEYSKIGIPVTLATLLIGIAWLQFVPY
jgi:Na+/H+ antiporter NhaD/arsenite permease-like protein